MRHRGNYISVGPFLKSWEKISEWTRSRLTNTTSDYIDLLRKQAKPPPPAPEEQELVPQEDPDAHDLGDILVDKEAGRPRRHTGRDG